VLGQLKSIERLSLNQMTTEKWSLAQAVEGCARAGVPWIAPWRHKIAEIGLPKAKQLIQDAGLKVSSVCRGGMFPAATEVERKERIEDNRRAVDEAAELGAEVLVLVCGPAPDKDIAAAREMVADGIAQLLPYAKSHGVKLGIEPLHPMYAAERSVIVTLDEATRLAHTFDASVGVVIDVFHVWWDPQLYAHIPAAKGRIYGFHVCDWIVPTPDMLLGRGMMGDGVIEIRRIREAVEQTGYQGPIEVEIFNQAIWDRPGDDVLEEMKERYIEHV
jgi:sugar phosphate isomerase/epimerase